MWHYAKDDRQLGPVSEEEMRTLIAQGEIAPTTLVWTEGMPDWIEAEKSALAGAFATPSREISVPPDPDGGRERTATRGSFSKREAIQFGWQTTLNNIGFFIGLLIVAGVLFVVPGWIAETVTEHSFAVGLILHIGDMLLSMLISLGMVKVSLTFCDHGQGRIGDLFSQYRLLLSYILATILYAIFTLFGFVLLIIPGIILSIMFFFYDFLIVDEKRGPIDALGESYTITKGSLFNLFLLFILLFCINFIGLLVFVVGLFVTVPLSMIALGYAFRKLRDPSWFPGAATASPDGQTSFG